MLCVNKSTFQLFSFKLFFLTMSIISIGLCDSKGDFTSNHQQCDGVTFEQNIFGTIKDENGVDQKVFSFTWTTKTNMSVQVINYGATIVSIKMPDKNGLVKDVALGYDNIEGYLEKSNPYFGATIGRVCNRIGGGKFCLNGKTYHVTQNIGTDSLHGGKKGFDKVIWNFVVSGTTVIMTYLSKDGEEGYPGDVIATVTFQLTNTDDFICTMKGTSTKPTPINLTNHMYFNLAGHDSGPNAIYSHEVMINADAITAVTDKSIPTGEIRRVFGTPYDLQVPRKLGDVIPLVPENGGYDINYCVNKGFENKSFGFVAQAVHPESGRVLEVYSDQPGVQFYTSNGMPTADESKKNANNERITGKNGTEYIKHSAFCFETQNYPDAVNHDNFPSSILNPNEVYQHQLVYKFRINEF